GRTATAAPSASSGVRFGQQIASAAWILPIGSPGLGTKTRTDRIGSRLSAQKLLTMRSRRTVISPARGVMGVTTPAPVGAIRLRNFAYGPRLCESLERVPKAGGIEARPQGEPMRLILSFAAAALIIGCSSAGTSTSSSGDGGVGGSPSPAFHVTTTADTVP